VPLEVFVRVIASSGFLEHQGSSAQLGQRGVTYFNTILTPLGI